MRGIVGDKGRRPRWLRPVSLVAGVGLLGAIAATSIGQIDDGTTPKPEKPAQTPGNIFQRLTDDPAHSPLSPQTPNSQPTTGPGNIPGGAAPPDPVPQPFNPWAGMERPVNADELLRRAATINDEAVLDSIEKGVNYLLGELQAETAGGEQRRRMSPFRSGDQTVGRVAASIYALLQVGRSTDDQRLRFSSKEMKAAVDWLLKAQTSETYSAAFQASALALLPDRPEFRKELKRVEASIVQGMEDNGAYGYQVGDRTEHPGRFGAAWWDNSNTQYGLLGVWAASEAGTEVDMRFWRLSDAHWRQDQQADGGWGYHKSEYVGGGTNIEFSTPSTATMTCAGVASLYVTADKLGGPIEMNPQPDKVLDAGVKKVIGDFKTRVSYLAGDLYYTYGIERVGLASGLHYFDHLDWYRLGAAGLMMSQAEDGSWEYNGPVVGTAYALLFLAHGRNPVVFSKLQYEGPWNARPRDDAKLTRWLGKSLERPLNWQSLDLDSDPREWLDAPILLITGHGDPQFSAESIAKLRAFILDGGMIFSTADGNDPNFTTAMKRYMGLVLDHKYEPRELPTEHVLYSIQYKISKHPTIIGLSNGLREVWVHSANDMGAAWQSYAVARTEFFQFPENLYLYAVGRTNLASRLKSPVVPATTQEPIRSIKLGRLEYAGNWDPEPGAWQRFAALARQYRVDVSVSKVSIGTLNAERTPIVHMTGTTRFTMNPENIGKLRAFLDGGGTLIVDAAGSSEPFMASLLETLKAVWPDRSLETITSSDRLFDGTVPQSDKIAAVEFRKFEPQQEPGEHLPELLGIKVGGKKADKTDDGKATTEPAADTGRWAVIVSRQDITSGLLGTNTWGIIGYTPKSAEALARNMVMYANDIIEQRTPATPASQPAGAPAVHLGAGAGDAVPEKPVTPPPAASPAPTQE